MPNTNRHRNYDTHRHHSPPKRHPKLLSIFLKFIVMSLILSLFLIFLGLAAIILLHVLLVACFFHGRRRSRNITPPPTSSYSLLDLQTHLPPFQYSSSSSSGDCSICLENFKEREFCRLLPECDHVFHADCVDSWLTKVPNCPVCRRRVRLEVDRSSDPIDSDDDCKFLWVIGAVSCLNLDLV
ncbi:RING-H2 finger protein ATL56-like [Cynara cardunculus var. scolymus]|uniref:RING-H2 finger protein ATL56-like n=1 Tax=Cynara cardunculus var. scolymus TaxID=59895 RepID=UPI000D628BB9|nr:RING-H2 finger protein ATL56-like [Cynara cardunculus var. scolymus]